MPAYKDKSSGKWMSMFYFEDEHGNKKKKAKRGFLTKREALEFEATYVVGKVEKSPLQMTMNEFIELYKGDKKNRIRSTTVANKSGLINRFIIPYLGKKRIDQLKPPDIIKWQNMILGMGYKPTYVKTINNQLVAILNHAVRYYDLSDNPCHKVGSIGKKNAERMKFWTLDQFNIFIKSVQNPIYYTAFNVLFYTGIRVGELIALTIEDIDFEEHHIQVNKSAQIFQGELLVSEPKTPKSNRIITIPNFLTKILQAYIELLYLPDKQDRIFPTGKAQLAKYIAKHCEQTGIPKIRVHDLRHSHASLLIEQNFQPLVIQERLGHEKIETTLGTYAHLYPNKQYQVCEKLDELHSPTEFPKDIEQVSTNETLILK